MSSFFSRNRRCDGLTRRDLLHVGGLTALGLSVTDLLRASAPGRRAKAAILIWLDGGPSHLETFDLKPDAPAEVRGPFKSIATNVPGIEVCELFPRTARLMNKLALIRSLTSPLGEHNLGAHYLLTGYKPTPALVYPSYGAVLAKLRGEGATLPPYVAVPDHNDAAGQGYLPGLCRPFAVGGDPGRPDFKVRDLEAYPGVTTTRLERRRDFLQALDQHTRNVEETADSSEFAQAYRLVLSSEARRAFDLSREPGDVRARYGPRTIGQSCLLARRLIEAGVPFVTVTDRGWDTHEQLVNRLKEGYTGGTVGKIPSLDLALSGLLGDLNERGLLEQTLVIVMGEFGRTPKLNPGGGRDHWPRVFSVALAGGGIRGGQVIGRSDARGESPAEQPITPEDLACTIYRILGVDPNHEFQTADGRPVPVNQGGKVIAGLV